MATRVKEGQPGKEKRGTSLPYRKSPSTSKQGSPNKSHDSTTPERSIPNYLKPTISSGPDPTKHHVKKLASNDSVQKGALARRRSLEKPLPSSHIQKTRISPNLRERNIRSSSFTSKTTNSQMPISDKLSKASKDAAGKEHSLHPRPTSVKKCNLSIKKQETEPNTVSAKPPKESPPTKVDTPDVVDIPQLALQEEDLDSSLTEVDEDILHVGENNSVEDNVLVVEDKVHMNLTQSEPENHEVQEVKIIESSPVSTDQDITIGATREETGDKLQVGEITSNCSELEEHGENEKDRSHPAEYVEEEPKIEVKNKIAEEASEDSTVQTLDEKEESSAGSQVPDSHKIDSAEEVTKEVKQDTEKTTANEQVVRGKKDSAVSNDVIEETASKLREQRKNKVKALAGAFETVISLQESK